MSYVIFVSKNILNRSLYGFFFFILPGMQSFPFDSSKGFSELFYYILKVVQVLIRTKRKIKYAVWFNTVPRMCCFVSLFQQTVDNDQKSKHVVKKICHRNTYGIVVA